MADYELLAKVDAAYIGLERAIKNAQPLLNANAPAVVLDVLLSRLAQARAESGFPRALDDARIAAGFEQCSECGEVLTPEHASGVLDLCAACARVRKWRCAAQ